MAKSSQNTLVENYTEDTLLVPKNIKIDPVNQVIVDSRQVFPDISIVGIITIIVYFLLFINIYTSATYEGKLGFSLRSRHGFTLSEAFKYGHRKTTTVLCVMFTGLYIGLMVDKGFLNTLGTDSDDTNIFIGVLLGLGFGLLLGFLFLFLIPPPGRKNTSQSMKHFLLALFILVFITVSSSLISLCYRKEYNKNEVINVMDGVSYAIIACGVLVILSGFGSMLTKTNYQKQFTWRILATSELSIMILFGVMLIIFAIMPKLIKYDKLCVGFLKQKNLENV